MARPISPEPRVRDAHAELKARLENAPAEHAEALLGAYEVLQGLHDRGVLDLMRGALGSSDKLLEIAVSAAQTPDAVRGTRNLLVLINMLGRIDPEVLTRLTSSLPGALEAATRRSEPPGLWGLMMRFRRKDARRGLAATQTLLEEVGRGLAEDSKNKSASGR
jgi:uncharacterized protein YjgD (DUF1641 family)